MYFHTNIHTHLCRKYKGMSQAASIIQHCTMHTFMLMICVYPRLAMTSIKVPDAVMSLALTPRDSGTMPAFIKALTRFQKEDPTFRVSGTACLICMCKYIQSA